MKKPMTFLLALGMLISLAACGGTTSGQEASTPPADSQTTEAASEGSRMPAWRCCREPVHWRR